MSFFVKKKYIKKREKTVGGLHCRRGSNGRHRQTYIRQENYLLYVC